MVPQLVDTLFGSEGIVRTDAHPRPAAPCLGAGATLAAAAVAAMAHGMELPEAVREAQEFTRQALRPRLPCRHGAGAARPLLLGARQGRGR
jgi:hydroxymethylpyrimidine/phosphomethylpyrimidine kinase